MKSGFRSLRSCDIWECSCSKALFFQICRTKSLRIYDVEIKDTIRFAAPISDRMKIIHCFESIQYIRSYGIISHLLKILRLPRILSLAMCMGLLHLLTNTVFAVELEGEASKQGQLHSMLQEQYGELPFIRPDRLALKAFLQKEGFAWCEVEQSGSVLKIRYRSAKSEAVKPEAGNNLIASKPGIISHYELKSGVKKAAINQPVEKGDLLVEGAVQDTAGSFHRWKAEGKVFAKTWTHISVTCEDEKINEGIQFYRMLLQARHQLSKDFGPDDTILQENILQFTHNTGKIKLYVHYEVLEDIAELQE